MGPAAVAMLVAVVGAAALGLAGCARRGPRQWACHVVMGLAMAAMLVPSLDPVGPIWWAAVLVAAGTWSVVAGARLRAAQPHGAPVPPGVVAAARESVELIGMAVLVVLMSAAAAAGGPGLPSSTSGHQHAAAAHGHLLVATLVGLLVVAGGLHSRAWAARGAVGHAHGRERIAAIAATVLTLGVMSAMAM